MYDFCIIGGGIIGLSVAYELTRRYPNCKLAVIDKEDTLAKHQTGHNSGVIHSGIYYTPDSLKANLCREGAEATKEFCTAHNIPFITCGKMLVATNELEAARMKTLEERALQNKIDFERLDATELKRREPNIAGVGALFIPATGIVDYTEICEALAKNIKKAGSEILLGSAITRIAEKALAVDISTKEITITSKQVIACAGLQADRIAALAGLKRDFRIVPFRGEYYRLPTERSGLINSLIYPIPDPALPFLGIHLTRMIDGHITLGPNAVLGMAREGYPKFSFNLKDTADFLTFRGFWPAIGANLKSGLTEMKNSIWKSGYLEMCRRYCPDLTLDDLLPIEAGIRAQAIMADGSFMHDFLIRHTDRTVHVCNAPSPAATSALPIGRMIGKIVAERRTFLT